MTTSPADGPGPAGASAAGDAPGGDTPPRDGAGTPGDPLAGVDADVAVIGAGPAGLAAACAAVAAGASVVLVDAGARPGGQFWRHREGDDGSGHHGWADFRRLRTAVDAAAASGRLLRLADHAAWHVGRKGAGPFAVHALHAGAERVVHARAIVIATGAYDRQLPFPGWTLPGVFTAGAVQALLKGHGVVAGRRVAVGGTGPFLLPVAAGLVEAGAEVVGVFEANRPTAFARHPLAVVRNAGKLVEGAGYLATLRHRRVPYVLRSAVIGALGEDEVTGVRVARVDREWRVVPGTVRTIACDTVAVGYGFTPQVELAVQLGCATAVDRDGSLVVAVGDDQESRVAGVFVAGEACGVGGAQLALAEGEVAGIHAAGAAADTRRGATRPGASAGPAAPAPAGEPRGPVRLPHAATTPRGLLRRRSAGRAFAEAMHEAFPVPGGWRGWLADDTVVCRCEEVTARAIADAVTDLGATDSRSARLFARPGMGLCQGRVCGYATACLVAGAAGRTPTADDLRAIATRPIAQPVPLAVIAGGDDAGSTM